MTAKAHTDGQVEAIAFEAVAFTETPTTIVAEAIREYERSQPEFRTDEMVSPDSSWGFLSQQVVGHEMGL